MRWLPTCTESNTGKESLQLGCNETWDENDTFVNVQIGFAKSVGRENTDVVLRSLCLQHLDYVYASSRYGRKAGTTQLNGFVTLPKLVLTRLGAKKHRDPILVDSIHGSIE
ncbi:hypothetical protein RJ639_042924 [Escallonia herrerae]|uniref:Uncharacterized protein n=1 Tax=Escallonia herrerae TaxID=1293975 RepID=A0AA88WBQ8_9ASTE|nr:hypothetical protein RJ639_042924 [Escallonia herrerae]